MKDKNQENRPNQPKERLCPVTAYRKGATKRQIVPETKTNQFDPRRFHLIIDLLRMVIYLRKGNGKPRRIDANKSGIRGRPLELLTKLARRPDIFLAPYDIGNMPPYIEAHFVRENIIQYVRKLRKNLFAENGADPRYILTSSSPYRVALSGDISVCLIEPGVDGEGAQQRDNTGN